MKRVKRDSRASLNESTLNSLIRISAEGPSLDEFDPNPAIQLWATSANRRSNQKARKPYKKKEMHARKSKVFIDDLRLSESSEESDESDAAESEWRDKRVCWLVDERVVVDNNIEAVLY